MSKETGVFVLGAVVFFATFLGIPTEYKEWIFIISGILLLGIGYRLRRSAFLKSIESENGERKADMFVESNSDTEHTEENEGKVI
jgi:hypothetical protein